MGSKPLVRPPRLTRGSRIALVAPAGPLLERDDLTRAEALCRALDYEPVMGAHAGGHHGYFSGTDDARLADLNAALRDPAVDAVWCIRGGYGVTRILDGVDFEALARRPRPVIGYSDITALLAAVVRRAGMVAFHAPTARAEMPLFSRRHFARVLTDPAPSGAFEALPPPADVLVPQAGPDGWSVDTTTSPMAVVLKGATCADVEKNGVQKVVIQYGCPTLITR